MARSVRYSGAIIRFEPDSFEKSLRAIKTADADIYKNLRKEIREIGRSVMAGQKAAVLGLAVSAAGSRGSGRKARFLHSSGATYNSTTGTVSLNVRKGNKSHSLRSAVANSLSLEVRDKASARVRTAGVRIRARGSKMPEDQRRLGKHMNYGRWKHPVFGNKDTWVTQTSLPEGWFDETFKRS
jgi:hypothetical protein